MKNRTSCNIYEREVGKGCTNKDLSIYGDKEKQEEWNKTNKTRGAFGSVVCVCALQHKRQVVVVVVWGMG